MAMRVFVAPGIGRLGTILAIGLALGAAAGAGDAIADDPPGCGCCGCNPAGFWTGSEPLPRDAWYVSTEGMAMQRLSQALEPVATLGASPTGAVALSQNDLDEPFQAGVRLLVGHTFDDSPYQVEVSYYWLSPWDTSAQVNDPTGVGTLFSPFTTPYGVSPNPFVDNNTLVAIHEISRLENGEVNLKYTLPLPTGDPTIALLFGLRHVGIREGFDYASLPVAANPVFVHAHTNNNLWGPQIGGLVEYGCHDAWIRVEGKAAICDNETDRDLAANVNGAEANHARLSQSNTAMAADISASIVWRPTSALTAKIGYQALWCDQLALAERNFAPDLASLTNATVQPPTDTGGHLVYHGPFAGLQVSW